MASKFAPHSTNFKFTCPSKLAGIPLFIVVYIAYIVVLTNFTTSTYDYTLEKQPTESIQPKPDPVLLSLDISLAELQNVSSLAQQTLTGDDSNNPQTLEALRNCTFLFEVAKSQLEGSMSLLRTVGQGDKVLTATEILTLDLLIKTSLACQDKCLDGLEKTGSMVLNDFRVRIQRTRQCISNSSEIFSEMYPLNLRASRRRICLFHNICVTKNL